MGLETGTYIEDLEEAWPLGDDPVSQGDDHIKLVKKAIKNSFPNTTGPWNTTSPITHGAATADTESATLGQVPKISSGYIDANGTILGGSGDFSVVKNGTGEYQITFTTAASSQYQQSLVAMPQGIGAGLTNDWMCSGFPADTVTYGVGIFRAFNQALEDNAFSFIRIIN